MVDYYSTIKIIHHSSFSECVTAFPCSLFTSCYSLQCNVLPTSCTCPGGQSISTRHRGETSRHSPAPPDRRQGQCLGYNASESPAAGILVSTSQSWTRTEKGLQEKDEEAWGNLRVACLSFFPLPMDTPGAWAESMVTQVKRKRKEQGGGQKICYQTSYSKGGSTIKTQCINTVGIEYARLHGNGSHLLPFFRF